MMLEIVSIIFNTSSVSKFVSSIKNIGKTRPIGGASLPVQ